MTDILTQFAKDKAEFMRIWTAASDAFLRSNGLPIITGIGEEMEPPQMAGTGSVLLEAQGLVHGPRAEKYGPPAENFKRIADLWHAAFGWDVTVDDIWQAFVLVKIARERNTPQRDTRVDVAGYAEAGDWVHRERAAAE